MCFLNSPTVLGKSNLPCITNLHQPYHTRFRCLSLGVQAGQILLHFAWWHRYCIFFTDTAYFTVWRFMAALHQASLSALFFKEYLLTLCLGVALWQSSQYFRFLHDYYICYGHLWSVIFNVATMTCWRHRWWLAYLSS